MAIGVLITLMSLAVKKIGMIGQLNAVNFIYMIEKDSSGFA